MAEKDKIQKTLEVYNDVFADIVNVLLFNGRRIVDEKDLTDAQTFSYYKMDENKVHGQERDVAKIWNNGEIRISFIGLENQMSTKSYKHAREIIDLFRVMSQNNKKIGVIFDEFNNNREAGGTFMTEDEMYEMFDRIESRGEQRKAIEDVKSFYANGASVELIAKSMNMTIEQVQDIVKDVVVLASL